MNSSLKRRQLLKQSAAAVSVLCLPVKTWASRQDRLQEAIESRFGPAIRAQDRVALKIPALTENGYSVPVEIRVDSPMTSDDYVQAIGLFAEENPISEIAWMELTPESGRAHVKTRIRLAGSQHVVAAAKMNDGRVFEARVFAIVTLAACVI